MPFYLFCLTLYAYGLLKLLFLQRQVSAELLIVLVMAVTLINGKPLSGALVACFIGFGLYLSFTIIRRNREKMESLVTQTNTTALLHWGDAIREVPVKRSRRRNQTEPQPMIFWSTTSTVVHGVGQKHGGSITVDGMPSQGTTFTPLLPRVARSSLQ